VLAVIFAGMLEDQDHRYASALAEQEAAEEGAAREREKILARFSRSLEQEMEKAGGAAEDSAAQWVDVVKAYLPELDETGRGEILRLLYQKGLLNEKPVLRLTGMDFHEAVLRNMPLTGINLPQINLQHAQMSEAHLEHSDFSGANLKRALLRFSDLSGAQLVGANLHVANLENANLESADLTRADLSGAYLKKANLLNSRVELQDLEQSVLIDTILPNGQKLTNKKGEEFLHKKDLEAAINGL